MVYIRKSVWANGGDFTDPLLYWYAKGVGKLREKALADKTSWNFMAAIHGTDIDAGDDSYWLNYGYYTKGEPLPSADVQAVYWNQCQHATWYFLPWHRGYIWSIEALVRQEIVKLGGPADWAMPYWDYSDQLEKDALLLPPAFSDTHLPDNSVNPLYVAQRYGLGATPIELPASDVTLEALTVAQFVGVAVGAGQGFGGGKTGFSHSGAKTGALERKPHNIVHVDIGGQDDQGPGLMAKPYLAGLDPIFWLHHANIDRLWVVWNKSDSSHTNPTDPAWLSGPQDRKFVVPNPDGSDYYYTPADMLDTTSAKLNYTYDQFVTATAVTSALATRTGAAPLAEEKPAELVGANADVLPVSEGVSSSVVHLDGKAAGLFAAPAQNVLRAQFSASGALAAKRDRYFLNLENIRATKDGFAIDVYLDLPEGADPKGRRDLLAGSIALFGVEKASAPDSTHGGLGITEVIDISNIVHRLVLKGSLDAGRLTVHLVPRIRLPKDAKVTVERVSLYRQPA